MLLFLRVFEGFVRSILFGYERYDLASIVSSAANLLTMLLCVGVVVLDYGPIEMILAYNVGTIGSIVTNLRIACLLQPGLRLWPTFNGPALREVGSFSFYSWIQGIGSLLLNHTDRLLIASILGTSALSYYVVCLQVAQQIHALVSRAASFLFPMVSTISELDDRSRLRRIYFVTLNLTTAGAVFIAVPIFILSENLLTLWIDADFAVQATPVLQILLLAFAVLATTIVPYNYMVGTGMIRWSCGFGLLNGALVALCTYLLLPWFGIVGAALARLCNLPTEVLSRLIIHRRILDDRRALSAIAIFPAVFVPFICAYIVDRLQLVNQISILQLVMYFLGIAAIAGVASWLLAWAVTPADVWGTRRRQPPTNH